MSIETLAFIALSALVVIIFLMVYIRDVEINANISVLVQSIGDIESVVSEQADGILHITQALGIIDTNTQNNALIAQAISTISKEVNAMSLTILEEASKKKF